MSEWMDTRDERCETCGHLGRKHDPEDFKCDTHVGLDPCFCRRFVRQGEKVKTPEQLNADFQSAMSDLHDGIGESIDQAVARERAAIAAWLEWIGNEGETTPEVRSVFHSLAVAVKIGDYPEARK